MFSLLWSEHCAYKHSRKLLRRLPTEGERVLMGPGENAGAVAVGDGWAVAFKVESHNHPSAVEPFQGAATGVGGILRDVFALGARPIAVLDSLRFGELDSERSRYLFDHVVAGIGHYGNSIGVPTVGGEVALRGALRAELPRQRDVRRPRPRRRHGARGRGRASATRSSSWAPRRAATGSAAPPCSPRPSSRAATTRSARPCRSATRSRRRSCSSAASSCSRDGPAGLAAGSRRGRAHLVGRRDGLQRRRRDRHRRRPGAAARGGHGAVRDHGLRVAGADARRGRARARSTRCSRCASAGRPARRWSARSPDSGDFRVLRDGEVVGEMPVAALVDECPLYDLTPVEPSELALREQPFAARVARRPGSGPTRRHPVGACWPRRRVASKRWAFEQYDSIVALAHGPAPRDGRRRGARISPRPARRSRSRSTATGGAWPAIPTRARSRPCSSARRTSPARAPSRSGSPTASTSATPRSRRSPGSSTARRRASPTPAERSGSRWSAGTSPSTTRPRRARSTRPRWSAWSASCPTPRAPARMALADGDAIAICGPFSPALAGSELAKLRGDLGPGLPSLPIDAVRAAIELVRDAVREGTVRAAHDLSDGGLACALAEMAIAGGVGLEVDLDPLVEARGCAGETALFGEGPGGFVLAGDRGRARAPGGRRGRRVRRRRRGRRPDRHRRRRG